VPAACARWGVTVLQAIGEMDAGDIWGKHGAPGAAGLLKSSLYRTEVAGAAPEAVRAAVTSSPVAATGLSRWITGVPG
jgi:putative two-component system hydrogenase maturation factor HypX/HoxX